MWLRLISMLYLVFRLASLFGSVYLDHFFFVPRDFSFIWFLMLCVSLARSARQCIEHGTQCNALSTSRKIHSKHINTHTHTHTSEHARIICSNARCYYCICAWQSSRRVMEWTREMADALFWTHTHIHCMSRDLCVANWMTVCVGHFSRFRKKKNDKRKRRRRSFKNAQQWSNIISVTRSIAAWSICICVWSPSCCIMGNSIVEVIDSISNMGKICWTRGRVRCAGKTMADGLQTNWYLHTYSSMLRENRCEWKWRVKFCLPEPMSGTRPLGNGCAFGPTPRYCADFFYSFDIFTWRRFHAQHVFAAYLFDVCLSLYSWLGTNQCGHSHVGQ